MIERPAAVVFDCDGVLVNSEPHSVVAWLDVLSRYGHPATKADLEGCVGLGFGQTHAVLGATKPLPPSGEVWPVLLVALERSFNEGLRVFADAIALLDAVDAAGLPVALASASPRQRLDLTLRAAGLVGRFSVSIAGDEVAASKPDPAVYSAALVALGRTASETVAIEDSVAGVMAAAGAGMRVVAVARDDDSKELLHATDALVVDRLDPTLLGF